jgi:NADPH-dependent F420 reductase
LRLALAGHEVVIGSRSMERADEAAAGVRARARKNLAVSGALNEEAATRADIVINTLPYEAQSASLPALLEAIGGKLFISTVVPMRFEKRVGASAIAVPEGSAAEQARALLGGVARVAGAFQTLSAVNLNDVEHELDADVLVTADDSETREEVGRLVETCAGLRAVDAGRLANTQYVEHITCLLVNVNRRYKAHSEIKILGLPDAAPA